MFKNCFSTNAQFLKIHIDLLYMYLHVPIIYSYTHMYYVHVFIVKSRISRNSQQHL